MNASGNGRRAMANLRTYRDTVEIGGKIYLATGVRGKEKHFLSVRRERVTVNMELKPDRRFPFGPALRNESIRRFIEVTRCKT